MPPWTTLSEISDSVPVALLGVDESGAVRVANAASCELLAYGRHQLLDRPLSELFRDPTQAQEFRTSLARGNDDCRRVVLQRGDGQRLRVDATPRSAGPGWVLTLQDAELVAHKERDLSNSILGVVHDLRNPLASLAGLSELLERELDADRAEPVHEYLTSFRSCIDKVQEQLRHLTELSLIPDRELERSRFSPRGVFEDLLREFKLELEKRRIRLVVPTDPEPVYANELRFRQVVLNLVANSIQYMGDVADACIRVELSTCEGGTVLVVSDNGQGIAEDAQTSIFELFSCGRIGGDSRAMGLGLAIARRTMTAHGGTIELLPHPAEGATFRLFFPG